LQVRFSILVRVYYGTGGRRAMPKHLRRLFFYARAFESAIYEFLVII
jgi:hypothetical protein